MVVRGRHGDDGAAEIQSIAESGSDDRSDSAARADGSQGGGRDGPSAPV
jgi:hypothetical protein